MPQDEGDHERPPDESAWEWLQKRATSSGREYMSDSLSLPPRPRQDTLVQFALH